MLLDWGEDKGQEKHTVCGQLGAYLGIGPCIPSKSSKLQHKDGGKRQQVPDLASVGSSCHLPAQRHLKPTGRRIPAAHRVAVAPWLWAGQGSTVLSRWILMPSPQEEVSELLTSKISCLLSQWCVKLKAEASCASIDGKAGMPPVLQTSASPGERLEEGQRALVFSLHGQEAPCGHLSSQLRTPGRRPATVRCLQHLMVLHSPVELISGKPHGLFSTNSLFNRQSKYENSFLDLPLVLKLTVMRRARVLERQTIPGWHLQGLAFIAA